MWSVHRLQNITCWQKLHYIMRRQGYTFKLHVIMPGGKVVQHMHALLQLICYGSVHVYLEILGELHGVQMVESEKWPKVYHL